MLAAGVRLLKTPEEFQQCERLQETVWGSLSVSREVMVVTQKYGGAVLGAFFGEKLAGFIYAFLARRNGKLIHWSHMMAVAPDTRDKGLGLRMKLAHRRLALERRVKSICWTYDPLQSRNAALNVRRLGARVEDYVVDCYGHFPSIIEKGLPSDRFVVNWEIASAAVVRRLAHAPSRERNPSLPCLNETRRGRRGFIENQRIVRNLRAPQLLVEIPSNTDKMREENLDLARRWRFETRKIFRRYFSAGYRVRDFISLAANGDQRCFYVLWRGR